MGGTPPEVLFDRYFYSRIPRGQRVYKGKADLDRLRDSVLPAHLLEDLQRTINQALQNTPPDPAHAPHGTFHFDYIESDVPNAVAFCYDEYAFIGATIALVNLIWDASFRLSRAREVSQALQRSDTADLDSLQAQLFRIQLFFIVGHEWSHHVLGHTEAIGGAAAFAGTIEPKFADEIVITAQRGDLRSQTQEVLADGYSAYYVLQNLIVEDERPQALALLEVGALTEAAADSILLSCFIVAIAGFMFVRAPQEVNAVTAYTMTHPPQALRLRLLLMSARLWSESRRPNLAAEISPERFRPIWQAIASATWGMNGGRDWSHQIDFLMSDVGDEYARKLIDSRNASVQAIGLDAPHRG
jgi:peptidase M48-like protein